MFSTIFLEKRWDQTKCVEERGKTLIKLTRAISSTIVSVCPQTCQTFLCLWGLFMANRISLLARLTDTHTLWSCGDKCPHSWLVSVWLIDLSLSLKRDALAPQKNKLWAGHKNSEKRDLVCVSLGYTLKFWAALMSFVGQIWGNIDIKSPYSVFIEHRHRRAGTLRPYCSSDSVFWATWWI